MRVLVLSQRLPYAPNRGDRMRVYHMLQEISSHARVDVASLVHDEAEEAHAADLAGIAEHVITARVPRLRNKVRAAISLAGMTPLTHALLDSPSLAPALASRVATHRPDVVLAFCSSMARFALSQPLSGIPCVVDMIDADSAKWSTLAKVSRPPWRWIYKREARLLSRFEVVAMRHAAATLVVNARERAALLELEPDGRVEVMEMGVDLASFAPPSEPRESRSVVFCGVMNYGPNVRAAVWLTRQVWPLVRAVRPDARLFIVGAAPTHEVRSLDSKDLGVTVTGTVPQVQSYLWDAAVAVAPVKIARGIQTKVLEAVAAGLPCVVTPEVAAGLPDEVTPACSIGATAKDFAEALSGLLARPARERRAIAARADLVSMQWSAKLRRLMPLLESAAQRAI